MALTLKRKRFVTEYLQDLNAAGAARRAGYSAHTADRTGYDLLRIPEVAQEVTRRTRQQLEDNDITAARVKREIARLAFQTGRYGLDDQGNFKPPSQWTDDEAAAISNVDVVIRNLAGGDGHTDRVVKIQKWDKGRALADLAKHFGLLVDKVELTVEISAITAKLAEGRKRVAQLRLADR